MSEPHEGFDLSCPRCGEYQDESRLHQSLMESSDAGEFRSDCHDCGTRILVRVHWVPEYQVLPLTCIMCKRKDVSLVNDWYCQECQNQLSALSAYNESRTA